MQKIKSKIESPIPWNSFRNQIPKEAADSLENIFSFLNPEKKIKLIINYVLIHSTAA